MLVSIKTLEGKLFKIEAPPESTVAGLKELIAASQGMQAELMKLIHSGKVLKDAETLAEKGVTEASFLVCMVTKPKKKPQAAPAAAAPASTSSQQQQTSAAPAPAAPATPASEPQQPGAAVPAAPQAVPAAPQRPALADRSPGQRGESSSEPTTTTTTTTTTSRAGAGPSGGASAEALAQLNAMGFGHEEQSRAALEAAGGNVDLAVEFLMNGIPDGITDDMDDDDDAADDAPSDAAAESRGPSSSSTRAGGPLAALRNHPQFDELRRTVQANPGALQTVLQHLGREDPELLRQIHANQADFLRVMNEPVGPPASSAHGPPQQQQQPGGGGGGGGGQGPPNPMGGLDEQAFARAMAQITPAQRAQVAATVGLTPEQLEHFAQQMQNMPREELRQLLGAFAAGAGAGGPGGFGGGPGMGAGGGLGGLGGVPGGGDRGGPRVVRLTREEADAVNRLCELGFSRDDAAQAYLACDKNESLAANLLFDGFDTGPVSAGLGGFDLPPPGASTSGAAPSGGQPSQGANASSSTGDAAAGGTGATSSESSSDAAGGSGSGGGSSGDASGSSGAAPGGADGGGDDDEDMYS